MLDIESYDEWFERNFENLVEKYPHKAIAMVGGDIVAVADSEREVHEAAKSKYPDKIPFVVTVPSEEDLICLLLLRSTSNTKD